MRHHCFAAAIVVTLFLPLARAQNLLANPGFESGNIGFQSDYAFSAGSNCCEGQYTVRALPNTFNAAFVNPPPVVPGSINMMVVNGSITGGLRIWYQTVAVIPGAVYQLYLTGCTAVVGGPAILQWQVNGSVIGSPLTLPNGTGQWVANTAEWTAPATVTSVEVAIRDLNTSSFPNDFYLDELSMSFLAAVRPYGVGCGGLMLAASPTPVLGNTVVFTTSGIPAGALFTCHVLSLGRIDPGLPLAPLGAPGCFQQIDLGVSSTILLSGSGIVTSGLLVPTGATWLGLNLHAQSAALVPGINALGVITSNGVSLVLGSA